MQLYVNVHINKYNCTTMYIKDKYNYTAMYIKNKYNFTAMYIKNKYNFEYTRQLNNNIIRPISRRVTIN